jgi:hypothetical protein
MSAFSLFLAFRSLSFIVGDQFVLYQPVQISFIFFSFLNSHLDVLEGPIKYLFRAWLIVLVVLVAAVVFILCVCKLIAEISALSENIVVQPFSILDHHHHP